MISVAVVIYSYSILESTLLGTIPCFFNMLHIPICYTFPFMLRFLSIVIVNGTLSCFFNGTLS